MNFWRSKTQILFAVLLIGLVFMPLGLARAADPVIEDTVRLEDESVHEGPLVLSGNSVTLRQPVNGSVWVLANTASIESEISGSLNVVARDVSLSGEVRGDAVIMGLFAEINGTVDGITSVVSSRLTTRGSLATLYAATLQAELFGTIESAWMASSQVQILDSVGDAHIKSSITSVGSDAQVRELTQVGRVAPIVVEGASVTELNHQETPFTAFGRYTGWQAYVAWFVSNLLWLLLGTLIMWRYAKAPTQKLVQAIRQKVFGSTFTGLTILVIGSVLAFGFIGTRVGIHLALVFFLALLLAAHMSFWVFSIALGGALGKLLWKEQKLSLGSVLLGVSAVAGLLVIPLVGSALILLISALGIGSLTRRIGRAKLPVHHD